MHLPVFFQIRKNKCGNCLLWHRRSPPAIGCLSFSSLVLGSNPDLDTDVGCASESLSSPGPFSCTFEHKLTVERQTKPNLSHRNIVDVLSFEFYGTFVFLNTANWKGTNSVMRFLNYYEHTCLDWNSKPAPMDRATTAQNHLAVDRGL